ncbi:MAG: AtpZ/AtpI family protein [Acidobacteria bacterium]|jgi:ATP synthase protein I|nr:AtpZ/AtpI family protein [Acidobacteriota bacterium]
MSGPDPSDLGDRIAQAQAKRDEKARRAERQRKNSINKPASQALRYSSELVAAVLVGVGLGLLIDHFAKSSPWGLLVMMGFGMAAGIRNLMRAAKQLSEDAQKSAATPESTDETT